MVRPRVSAPGRRPDAAEFPVPAEGRGDDLLARRRLGAEFRRDTGRARGLVPRRGVRADALDALEADRELADVLGGYFVASFLAYKRNEIERFERDVTDWEFREYAYHL